ncbi:acyltransferase family protein [Asticcacaulis sp. AC460]|uniref:acyltransferase family protein n=1 Tax=Asticcacaulis sp. AC460 TaxID=1282360 RepID=UPI0003FEBEED|nr:acyltransferase [Asticcacaulis sp. AC460]
MKPLSVPSVSSVAPADIPARRGGASLDVLRFLAAAFILLFHFGPSAPLNLRLVSPIFEQGWLATDFFLMLSGFVLSRAYGDRLTRSQMRPTHFFLKRFARLWPSHVVVLLTFAAFIVTATLLGFPPNHGDHYGLNALFAQAFMVHGWGIIGTPTWNIPTWTLSALLVCYGLFAVYARWVHDRPLIILAGVAVAVLAMGHILAETVAKHAFADLPLAWGLLRAIPLFILGNLIERATASLRLSQALFWPLVTFALAGAVGLALLPRHLILDTVILTLLGTVLAVSGAVTFREMPVSQRLGRASFALFLVHSLVGAVWFSLTPKVVAMLDLGFAAQWALWATALLAAMITAFLFDAVVDKPLSAWVSKLSFVRGGV